MIAGQLPVDPTILSPGSGAVDIDRNLIQANLANDDGGGIRFLMAGNFPMNVVNNIIANNISTHEGGGIAIDDAPNVRIVNDTIVKNITTATAATSTGQPAPAGIATGANSELLRATLPGTPVYSSPTMFNDILWDNRAGTRALGTVTGIGIAGDVSPIVHWDIGASDASGLPNPTHSMLEVTTGTTADPTNTVGVDPTFIDTYDTSVAFQPWRTNPNLIGAIMVATDVPPTLMGDYHIPTTSPAVDNANSAASVGTISAPTIDFDGGPRPTGTRRDMGADELPGVPTVVAFPTTGVLDAFNRANGLLGTTWGGNTTSPNPPFQISGSRVQVRASGQAWWASGAEFGANQEAYLTLTTLGNAGTAEQGLLLKAKSMSPTSSTRSSWIKVVVTPGNQVQVWTKRANRTAVLRATLNVTFVAGNTLGVRTESDGSVTVYKNGVSVGSTNVASGANAWPSSLVGSGGRIGVTYAGTSNANPATFDDFGGGARP